MPFGAGGLLFTPRGQARSGALLRFVGDGGAQLGGGLGRAGRLGGRRFSLDEMTRARYFLLGVGAGGGFDGATRGDWNATRGALETLEAL